MDSEFEEKSYELPLAHQLLCGDPRVFAPGQVLENDLGFDQALHALHAGFWALWGHKSPPGGTVMNGGWWPSKKRTGVKLPSFSLNLFLQCKRSHFLYGPTAKERSEWKQDYYRFEIVPHQQAALDRCARAASTRALVLYAAPAFHLFDELDGHIGNGTLPSASNFSEAIKLNNHKKYTFISGGRNGKAHSEPEEIPVFSFNKDLGPRIERANADTSTTNTIQVAAFALRTAVGARGTSADERISRAVQQAEAADVDKRLVETHIRPFLEATYFSWMLGLTWLVAGTVSSQEKDPNGERQRA